MYAKPTASHRQPQDLLGQTFGRWTVIGQPVRHNRSTYYRCRCQCGTEKSVPQQTLKKGKSQSCGCLQRESARDKHTTHGRSKSSECRAWNEMKKRCLNQKSHAYGRYGGRGIKVCERWLHSFDNFYADMGPRPSPKHSIDRFPDNDGDYEPGNCRWATKLEQGNNKRNNRVLTQNGLSMTVAEWSRHISISEKTIYNRLYDGWSVERALTEPPRTRRTRQSPSPLQTDSPSLSVEPEFHGPDR